MKLKISDSMTMMPYSSAFTKLSTFVQEVVSFERPRIRRFEEGFAFYIRNQLACQPIFTYQELYD